MQRQNPMKEAKSLLLYRKRTRKKPNMQKIPNILSMNLEQGDQEEKCRIERITVLNQKKGEKRKNRKKRRKYKVLSTVYPKRYSKKYKKLQQYSLSSTSIKCKLRRRSWSSKIQTHSHAHGLFRRSHVTTSLTTIASLPLL